MWARCTLAAHWIRPLSLYPGKPRLCPRACVLHALDPVSSSSKLHAVRLTTCCSVFMINLSPIVRHLRACGNLGGGKGRDCGPTPGVTIFCTQLEFLLGMPPHPQLHLKHLSTLRLSQLLPLTMLHSCHASPVLHNCSSSTEDFRLFVSSCPSRGASGREKRINIVVELQTERNSSNPILFPPFSPIFRQGLRNGVSPREGHPQKGVLPTLPSTTVPDL